METKKWFKSLTIWGGAVLMMCGLVLPLIGKADYATVLAEEQAGIITWLGTLGELIGAAMVFIGRFRAVKRIG